MLCYDVYKNGQRICRAGVGKSGVLSVIVSWVGNENVKGRSGADYHSDLHIGGLFHPEPKTNTHIRWPDPKLHVGDELTVRLVEADNPDPPTSTEVDDPAATERMQRKYYQVLKRQFEPKRGRATGRKATKKAKPRSKRS